MIFDMFSKQGTLNRCTYYIHCCLKNDTYFFSCIYQEGVYVTDEYYFSYKDTATLADAVQKYVKELQGYVERSDIKDFYFQGQLVLTLTPTINTKTR